MQLLRQPAATGVNTRVVSRRNRTVVTKVCAKEECRGAAAAATHTQSLRQGHSSIAAVLNLSQMYSMSKSGLSQRA
jgi:Mg2+/Co2+ transporter CorB